MQATFNFSLDLDDDEDDARDFCNSVLESFMAARTIAKKAKAKKRSVAAPLSPEPAANADLKQFFEEQPSLADAPTAVETVAEPKKRGRKAKHPSAAIAEPLPLDAPADDDPFGAPIENLQELIDLGNSVCKDLGPQHVSAVLKEYRVGRYSEIAQSEWTTVARRWRKLLNESAK